MVNLSTPESPAVDSLDTAIIHLFAAEPRIGVLECSRRLGIARGTVQARLQRLSDRGVVAGYGPEVEPEALGYAVTAFSTLQIRQGRGRAVVEHLAGIPQVLEMHTTSGSGDMLCRIVARSNRDLQRVIDLVVASQDVLQTSSVISLTRPIPYRVLPLLDLAAGTGA